MPVGRGCPAAGVPPVPPPARTDVAIVGGGYTGLSAARTLARQGVAVTVLERHGSGGVPAAGTAGSCSRGIKPEVDELSGGTGVERARRAVRRLAGGDRASSSG